MNPLFLLAHRRRGDNAAWLSVVLARAGEVEPYLQVVEHYQDRPLALFALYTLTTSAKVLRFAREDKQRKMIICYRKKCLKRIEATVG